VESTNINTKPEATYTKYQEQPHKPGLYLGLFHGRNEPAEQMEGWGFTGPAIGPLKWVHTTYANNIKIEFENAGDAAIFFVEDRFYELRLDGDLLIFDGKYYGDWTVYYVTPEDCARPADTFRKVTRRNDLHAHHPYL
jgi:hypothetical protein